MARFPAHAPNGAAREAREGQRAAAGTGGAAKARQAAKRAVFPKINQAIIAAAERDMTTMIFVVEPLIPQMNLVNLSTALHRIARVSSGDLQALEWLRIHPLVPKLVQATVRSLEQAQANSAPPKCQALSNITWALATLKTVDLQLLGMVAKLARETMASFKAFELSGMLWGFAQLGTAEPKVKELAYPVFVQATDFISPEFTFRCLAMTVWAFATAGHDEPVLFQEFGDRLLPHVPFASSPELVNIAWAFKAVGSSHNRLLAEVERIALRRLGDFSPEELVDVLSNSRHRATSYASQHSESGKQWTQAHAAHDSGSPVYASWGQQSKQRDEDTGEGFVPPIAPSQSTCSMVSDDSGTSSPQAEHLEVVEDCFACSVDAAAAQEFKQCAEAAAAAVAKSGRLDPWASAINADQQAGRTRWVCSVKNTFVDVEENEDNEEEEEAESRLKRLGPSLDFIRGIAGIDEEKLEAYRSHYQKFRAGKANGAKGEMTSWVAGCS